MSDPYFIPAPLDTKEPCDARYSPAVITEVTDALITAQDDPREPINLDREEFLAALWRRGFKVVPNGDGQWQGDDNGGKKR
jgi:hypothetical protein